MSKPYSYDLRQKVIQAMELDGMKKSEAAQVFQLSRNTIDLWLKQQAGDRRLPGKVESPPSHSRQNHGLGQVHSVCQTAWGENTSRDGSAVGR